MLRVAAAVSGLAVPAVAMIQYDHIVTSLFLVNQLRKIQLHKQKQTEELQGTDRVNIGGICLEFERN